VDRPEDSVGPGANVTLEPEGVRARPGVCKLDDTATGMLLLDEVRDLGERSTPSPPTNTGIREVVLDPELVNDERLAAEPVRCI
jgi:hypothetical protein